jgi:putative chitinase
MLNKELFFSLVRKNLGKLNQRHVDGFNAMMDEFVRRGLKDLRHLAYMLATAWHETAHTMGAIEEYGRGRYQKYGKKDPTTGFAYYGRGLVQLTWADNYKRMGKLLGLPLYENPNLALNLDVAVQILFEGMLKAESLRGDFTGKSLEDYFNDHTNDAINARRIINGVDRAKMIALLHQKFLAALEFLPEEPSPIQPLV